jgi:hypothetical protein
MCPVLSTIPNDLSKDRWTLHHGDVRAARNLLPSAIDYLFIDAAHTARFARWYVDSLLECLNAGTPVSVHDVYHHRRAGRFSEGRVVLDWLARRHNGRFTASAKAATHAFEEIAGIGTIGVQHERLPVARPGPTEHRRTIVSNARSPSNTGKRRTKQQQSDLDDPGYCPRPQRLRHRCRCDTRNVAT